MKLDEKTGSQSVVLDVVKAFDPEKDEFAGIYTFLTDCFPDGNFVVDEDRIVINSLVGSTPCAFVVNLTDGSCKKLASQTVIHDLKRTTDFCLLVGQTHNFLEEPQVQSNLCDLFAVDLEPLWASQASQIV